MKLLPSEQVKVDRLIANALQDTALKEQLLRHDKCLQTEYALSQSTWQGLCQIQAGNLQDFCRQFYGLPLKED